MLTLDLTVKPTWAQKWRAELRAELELLDGGIAQCDAAMARFRSQNTAFSLATREIVFRAEKINDRPRLEAEWRGLAERRQSLVAQKSDVLQELADLAK